MQHAAVQLQFDLQMMEAQRMSLKVFCKKENVIDICIIENDMRATCWKDLDLDLSDSECEITGATDE